MKFEENPSKFEKRRFFLPLVSILKDFESFSLKKNLVWYLLNSQNLDKKNIFLFQDIFLNFVRFDIFLFYLESDFRCFYEIMVKML